MFFVLLSTALAMVLIKQAIFGFKTLEYPKHWNRYELIVKGTSKELLRFRLDSLGECNLTNSSKDLAFQNFIKCPTGFEAGEKVIELHKKYWDGYVISEGADLLDFTNNSLTYSWVSSGTQERLLQKIKQRYPTLTFKSKIVHKNVLN